MSDFFIQRLVITHACELQQLSVITFIDTYASFNTAANIEMHLSKHFSIEKLTAELSDSENYFFAAFKNGKATGYVKLRISEKPSQLNDFKHIELERIYVDKPFHGSGLGYLLMQYCLNHAAQNGYEVLWLGVWNQNVKALAFYKRCGFEIFGEYIFKLGSDEQVDFLMKKHLAV